MVTTSKEITYPESDGKPMADSSKQWDWIAFTKLGVEATFQEEPLVLVCGDLLWYPEEGHPEINAAPDVMIVFGRPKGPRRSYLQWKEGNIPPQVVFEIWSHTNTKREMEAKRAFYLRYGVQEYYEFDPERIKLEGWTVQNGQCVKIPSMQGWVSPLLKIRFELDPTAIDEELRLFRPDGQPFVTYIQLERQKVEAELLVQQERYLTQQERERAEQERLRAQQALTLIEQERLRIQQFEGLIEQERLRARQAERLIEQERLRTEQERLRTEQAEQEIQKLRALLAAQNPNSGQ